MKQYRWTAIFLLLLSNGLMSQNLDNLTLIAHYPLTNDNVDITGKQNPMTLVNTLFQDGGIYCNGEYLWSGIPGGCDAHTPELIDFSFKKFAFSAEILVNEKYPSGSHPIFVGGDIYRWLVVSLDSDNYVHFDQKYDQQYATGTWQTVTVTYDSIAKIARCYLGSLLADETHLLTLSENSEKMVSITDRDAGTAFKGIFRNLKVYSILKTSEIDSFAQDSLALVALYNATDGPNWTNNTNWLTGPVSTWHGITLEDGRVFRIVLSDNNLVGTLPPELAYLNKLAGLYLGNNQISGNIPFSIDQMTSLSELHLESNKLADMIPDEICNLHRLSQLYLNNNELGGKIPDDFGKLTNMKYLSLNDNYLYGSIPQDIGNMTKLSACNLGRNQLSGSIPASFGSCSEMHSLILNGNELTGPIPPEINGCSNLEYLDLADNQIEGTIPSDMGDLTRLETLYLDMNLLGGTIPAFLGSLTALKYLSLHNNQFTGDVPTELTNAINLTYFYCSNNQLTGFPDFSGHSKLEQLAIFNNCLTFESIEPNLAIPSFNYAPQDSVGEKRDTTLAAGSSLTLSVNVGGTANVYQWRKNGADIHSADDNELVLDSLNTENQGIYTCQITNTLATELTLFSRSFHVSVTNSDLTPLQQDSLALVALYNSTDGDNWTNNENWLTGPISTWHGITVDNDRVIDITLEGNGLAGSIPPEIENLTSLTYINLSLNRLSGSIPSELGNLTNLVRLWLNDNKLIGSIPNELRKLINIKQLYLYRNNLTGSIPPDLNKLENLNFLYLHENKLTGTIPAEFGNLEHLRGLDLSKNQLEGNVPTELNNLEQLSQLYISDNHFSDMPNLSSLVDLLHLHIQNNQFTFGDIEPYIGIANFQYSPQDSVGETQDTTIAQGNPLTLAIIVDGTANQYQWLHDDIIIDGAEDSVYTLDAVALSDSGAYTCQITNTIATDLTLYSHPINVHITSSAGISDQLGTVPDKFALLQNYPNPFNPETIIRYSLPDKEYVKLRVFNLKGEVIITLEDGIKNPGIYQHRWNGRNKNQHLVSSGIYIYELQAGVEKRSGKMMLIR